MEKYDKLIKALRCCISKNPPETCVGCTYSKCNNECAVRRMILDAAAAIEELEDALADECSECDYLVNENARLTTENKELQAQLPKRGQWELIDGAEPMRWGCSRCKYLSWETSNYCPNCGAKMEAQDADT